MTDHARAAPTEPFCEACWWFALQLAPVGLRHRLYAQMRLGCQHQGNPDD